MFLDVLDMDTLHFQHQDLYDMLYRLAKGAGAEIIHGAEVVDVIPGSLKKDAGLHFQ